MQQRKEVYIPPHDPSVVSSYRIFHCRYMPMIVMPMIVTETISNVQNKYPNMQTYLQRFQRLRPTVAGAIGGIMEIFWCHGRTHHQLGLVFFGFSTNADASVHMATRLHLFLEN